MHDVNVLSVRYETPHNCSLTLSRPITDLITTHQWPHPDPISSNSLSFVSKIIQSVRITCFFHTLGLLNKRKKKVSKMFTEKSSLIVIAEDLQTPGCVYTPWSDWSDCPVTCGISQSVRKRFLQSASATSCDSFMMETSKCMTSSSCVSACAYSDWSDWMPCSTSCGVGDTMRKKFLTSSGGLLLFQQIVRP